MSPSTLLNSSPDTLREHSMHGLPASPLGEASERRYAGAAFLVFAALAGLLFMVL